MTFEVCPSGEHDPVLGSEAGVIVIRDVKAQLLDVRPGQEVSLVVVTSAGEPVVGQASVVQKPSGRGLHLAFACPTCTQVAFKLYPAPEGGLACRSCARHRSRRQREHTTRAWEAGGELEDALLRTLAKGGPAGRALPDHLYRMVNELHDMDVKRLASLGFLPWEFRTDAANDTSGSTTPADPGLRSADSEEWADDLDEPGAWSPDPPDSEDDLVEMTPAGLLAQLEFPTEPLQRTVLPAFKTPAGKGHLLEFLAEVLFEPAEDPEPRG